MEIAKSSKYLGFRFSYLVLIVCLPLELGLFSGWTSKGAFDCELELSIAGSDTVPSDLNWVLAHANGGWGLVIFWLLFPKPNSFSMTSSVLIVISSLRTLGGSEVAKTPLDLMFIGTTALTGGWVFSGTFSGTKGDEVTGLGFGTTTYNFSPGLLEY